MQAVARVAERVIASAFGRTAGRLEARLGTPVDRCRAGAWEIMAAGNMDLIELIKLRDDDHGVFLVQHPDHGRCMLKTSFPAHSAVSGLANLQLAKWVQETDPPLFPKVLEASADHWIERYIDGLPFRGWVETEFRQAPMERFLEMLRFWSESTGPWDGPERLQMHEVRSIVSAYVSKIVAQSRYHGLSGRLAALSRLRSREDEFRRRLDRLADRADKLVIPRGVMCGDMGNMNLVVERQSNRIYNIDYEFMQPGHRGFDCAYLLAALGRLPTNDKALERIGALCLSPDYLGGSEVADFFTEYAEILISLARTISGNEQVKSVVPQHHPLRSSKKEPSPDFPQGRKGTKPDS